MVSGDNSGIDGEDRTGTAVVTQGKQNARCRPCTHLTSSTRRQATRVVVDQLRANALVA